MGGGCPYLSPRLYTHHSPATSTCVCFILNPPTPGRRPNIMNSKSASMTPTVGAYFPVDDQCASEVTFPSSHIDHLTKRIHSIVGRNARIIRLASGCLYVQTSISECKPDWNTHVRFYFGLWVRGDVLLFGGIDKDGTIRSYDRHTLGGSHPTRM
jgi:hypothetical protein